MPIRFFARQLGGRHFSSQVLPDVKIQTPRLAGKSTCSIKIPFCPGHLIDLRDWALRGLLLLFLALVVHQNI
jgi:hypothetical protein